MDDNTKVEGLRKEREAQRTQASKLIAQIEEYKKDPEHQLKLSVLKTQLGLKRDELKIMDKELIVKTTDKELEKEVENAEMYQFNLLEAMQRINLLLDKNITEAENKKTTGLHEDKIKEVHLNAKFPKIEIPKFSGNITEWRNFWNIFKKTIHNRNDISIIEKLTYLISLLQGEAARTIQGFDVTEENYLDILKVLEDQYGDKEIIVEHHINELMKLKPVKSITNLVEVRRLITDITNHYRTLRNLDLSSTANSEILYTKIKALLPDEIMLLYERNRTKETCNIDNILEFSQKEIRIREKIQPSSSLNIHAKEYKPTLCRPNNVSRPFYLPRVTVPRYETWNQRTWTPRPPHPQSRWIPRPPHPQSRWIPRPPHPQSRWTPRPPHPQSSWSQEPFPREKSNTLCFRCGQPGHTSQECRKQSQ